MAEFECPILDMARQMGLPDCNSECKNTSTVIVLKCPNASDDDLFPAREVYEQGTFSGQSTVRYQTEKGLLTMLSDIKLTVFDRNSKEEKITRWVDVEEEVSVV